MVEVTVGVDDGAQTLAGFRQHCVAHLAGEPRVLLGVNDEQTLAGLDRARIGVTARPDPRMDAVGQGHEMGFSIFLFSHSRTSDVYED
jgi:hypothetical protein